MSFPLEVADPSTIDYVLEQAGEAVMRNERVYRAAVEERHNALVHKYMSNVEHYLRSRGIVVPKYKAPAAPAPGRTTSSPLPFASADEERRNGQPQASHAPTTVNVPSSSSAGGSILNNSQLSQLQQQQQRSVRVNPHVSQGVVEMVPTRDATLAEGGGGPGDNHSLITVLTERRSHTQHQVDSTSGSIPMAADTMTPASTRARSGMGTRQSSQEAQRTSHEEPTLVGNLGPSSNSTPSSTSPTQPIFGLVLRPDTDSVTSYPPYGASFSSHLIQQPYQRPSQRFAPANTAVPPASVVGGENGGGTQLATPGSRRSVTTTTTAATTDNVIASAKSGATTTSMGSGGSGGGGGDGSCLNGNPKAGTGAMALARRLTNRGRFDHEDFGPFFQSTTDLSSALSDATASLPQLATGGGGGGGGGLSASSSHAPAQQQQQALIQQPQALPASAFPTQEQQQQVDLPGAASTPQEQQLGKLNGPSSGYGESGLTPPPQQLHPPSAPFASLAAPDNNDLSHPENFGLPHVLALSSPNTTMTINSPMQRSPDSPHELAQPGDEEERVEKGKEPNHESHHATQQAPPPPSEPTSVAATPPNASYPPSNTATAMGNARKRGDGDPNGNPQAKRPAHQLSSSRSKDGETFTQSERSANREDGNGGEGEGGKQEAYPADAHHHTNVTDELAATEEFTAVTDPGSPSRQGKAQQTSSPTPPEQQQQQQLPAVSVHLSHHQPSWKAVNVSNGDDNSSSRDERGTRDTGDTSDASGLTPSQRRAAIIHGLRQFTSSMNPSTSKEEESRTASTSLATASSPNHTHAPSPLSRCPASSFPPKEHSPLQQSERATTTAATATATATTTAHSHTIVMHNTGNSNYFLSREESYGSTQRGELTTDRGGGGYSHSPTGERRPSTAPAAASAVPIVRLSAAASANAANGGGGVRGATAAPMWPESLTHKGGGGGAWADRSLLPLSVHHTVGAADSPHAPSLMPPPPPQQQHATQAEGEATSASTATAFAVQQMTLNDRTYLYIPANVPPDLRAKLQREYEEEQEREERGNNANAVQVQVQVQLQGRQEAEEQTAVIPPTQQRHLLPPPTTFFPADMPTAMATPPRRTVAHLRSVVGTMLGGQSSTVATNRSTTVDCGSNKGSPMGSAQRCPAIPHPNQSNGDVAFQLLPLSTALQQPQRTQGLRPHTPPHHAQEHSPSPPRHLLAPSYTTQHQHAAPAAAFRQPQDIPVGAASAAAKRMAIIERLRHISQW